MEKVKHRPRWRAWSDLVFVAIAFTWAVIGLISHDTFSVCMAILMFVLADRR